VRVSGPKLHLPSSKVAQLSEQQHGLLGQQFFRVTTGSRPQLENAHFPTTLARYQSFSLSLDWRCIVRSGWLRSQAASVLRWPLCPVRLKEKDWITCQSRGKWRVFDAVGLDRVVTLEELLAEETMLLLAQLRPLCWKGRMQIWPRHTHTGIPGPKRPVLVSPCLRRGGISPRRSVQSVLCSSNTIGPVRCRQTSV